MLRPNSPGPLHRTLAFPLSFAYLLNWYDVQVWFSILRTIGHNTQEWDNETSICKAFSIGRTESKAVVQLLTGMDPAIRDTLETTVRRYGMRSFIYHDVLAKECFSRGFCSAVSGMESWSSQLTNGSKGNDPVVARMLSMCFNVRYRLRMVVQ